MPRTGVNKAAKAAKMVQDEKRIVGCGSRCPQEDKKIM
jgi:hypothetical protein